MQKWLKPFVLQCLRALWGSAKYVVFKSLASGSSLDWQWARDLCDERLSRVRESERRAEADARIREEARAEARADLLREQAALQPMAADESL